MKAGRGNKMNLFPFLSLFICVMGVLAFLQVLIVSGGSREISLQTNISRGYQTAFQIFCLPGGVVSVPPTGGLQKIIERSSGETRQKVEEIARRRAEGRNERASMGQTDMAVAKIGEEDITNILNDISIVNSAASGARVEYEEFLLFGVYPGGGKWYRDFRTIAYKSEYRTIATGAEPLDSNWKLSFGGSSQEQP